MRLSSLLLGTLAIVTMVPPGHALDLSLTAAPYTTGGLYTNPVFPVEGETVQIVLRAQVEGETAGAIPAELAIGYPSGLVRRFPLSLTLADGLAEGVLPFSAPANGIYTVTATLDPEQALNETDESNNTAQITLPVVVAGRELNFVWYGEEPTLRWTTCVASANDEAQRKRLAERGITPLHWEYGGMSWSYYDKERAQTDPEAVLSEIEAVFDGKFSGGQPPYAAGPGIDETGGYPGSFKERASAASMRAMVRAKRAHPERFFAVWHGGGLREELAQYYREGADLLLVETYLFRAIPDELGLDDIYETIEARLGEIMRSADMLLPAYGNHCYTLIALDACERPDWIDLGEQEQVVRAIRRLCPEMRGIAWYNSGYGGYGLERSESGDRQREAVVANAERLFWDYWVRPCVTIMPQSVWTRQTGPGEVEITCAVSNLGAMDSGPVVVGFYVDGRCVDTVTVGKVPAGRGRLASRALSKQVVEVSAGPHIFSARILTAREATVLDPRQETDRYVE